MAGRICRFAATVNLKSYSVMMLSCGSATSSLAGVKGLRGGAWRARVCRVWTPSAGRGYRAPALSIHRAVSHLYSLGRSVRPPSHHRRRATATPNRNATNSEPSGASRATLLKMLNGIPGFRPASIAPLTRWTVPFTASETSAMVDFGSGTGPKPSWEKGASGMSSLTI
jgi:hypothetical protein